ncbi:restriction endonuclease subunit S [Enterococcus faecalis]|uniref:restriction endonuclease subunit S n=1 Tax=Enterococcus faecalis TaxID=1351 RepID=UPI00115A4EB7|nr:restriction endonuclease subunit S [Enterococcus faecalis]HAP5699558.1 restriction endonuclease subunit S [Enterococcus faecalis]
MKKVPRLRFRGFSEDWEQRKLGEVTEKIGSGKTPKGGNSNYQSHGVALIRSQNIFDDRVNNNDIAYISDKVDNDMKNSRVFKNDVLLNITGASIGRSAVYQSSDTANVNQHVCIIRPKDNIVSNFIQLNISSTKGQKEIELNQAGGGREGLNFQQIAKMIFSYPSYDEQQVIGLFFEKINDTITLHQRKLEQLKELKKTYLQVMFPRKDERVPKLRFADFEGEWAQRKLGEISTHRSGTAIERYFTEDGKYKVISIGSYGTDSKYVDQGIRAISNEITNARVVHKGELTMVLNDKTSDGAIIGRSLLIESEEEYVINQRTEIISPKDDFNVNFAYTTLNNTFRQKVKKIVQGGTQIYVNYPAVKNLMLDFPSYKEQTKIGTFFKQFDDTITLHQNKLDQLKTLKKTYLQNMFI